MSHLPVNQHLILPSSGLMKFFGTLGIESMMAQTMVRVEAQPHAYIEYMMNFFLSSCVMLPWKRRNSLQNYTSQLVW